MPDSFDFSKFIAEATNPPDETRREHLRDAVSDEMESAMAEVGPRMWCILQEQMERDATNTIHLNAILNAAIFSLVVWLAACTPKGSTMGRDNDDALREKFLSNLDNALAHRSTENAREIGTMGRNVGKLKLMQDANDALANILVQNSLVIKGCHEVILGMQKRQ